MCVIAACVAMCSTSCTTALKMENRELRDVTNSLQEDVYRMTQEKTILRNQIDSLVKIITMKDSVYHEVRENREVERRNDTVFINRYVHDYWYNYSSKTNSTNLVKNNTLVSNEKKEESEAKTKTKTITKTITITKTQIKYAVPRWAWGMAGAGLLSLLFSSAFFIYIFRKRKVNF